MERGSYSKGQKEGKFYIKTIKPKTPIENIIYNTLNSDNNIIYKYVKDLEK